jgi:hypothetical protein
MSVVTEVIIGGWTTALAMFGFFALNESGKLLKIRKNVASWLESAAAVVRADENLKVGREDAA